MPDPRMLGPSVRSFKTVMILPYAYRIADVGGRKETDRRNGLLSWLDHGSNRGPDFMSLWSLKRPLHLHRESLVRWFNIEIRSLFYGDPGSSAGTARKAPGGSVSEDMTRMPKIRWFQGTGNIPGTISPNGVPVVLSDFRLGQMEFGVHATNTVKLFPKDMKCHYEALFSRAGILMLLCSIKTDKKPRDLRASYALDIAHHAAYSDDSSSALVLVPKELAENKEIEVRKARGRDETTTRVAETVVLNRDEVEQCISMWTRPSSSRISREAPVPRMCLPDILLKSFAGELESLEFYPLVRGRIPTVTRFLFECSADAPAAGEPKESQGYMGEAENAAALGLQWPWRQSVDRRDGSASLVQWVAPCALNEVQGPEFQTLMVTRAQRIHLSCAGMVAWGYCETNFDVSHWNERLDREYFLTFVLALHQNLCLQDLSWKSYSHADDSRDNEVLNKLFREFTTDYDFSIASHQFNIQRVYRTARDVLGVERLSEEVRAELAHWLESESREEQRLLNSVAVIAFLLGLGTWFVGLDLSYFNNDSMVTLGWDEGRPSAYAWMLLPFLVIIAISATSRGLRQHWRRFGGLLFRKLRYRRPL